MPHMGQSSFVKAASGGLFLAHEKTQTSKQLRLRPAVHRDVVPREQQLSRSERTVLLPPSAEHVVDHSRKKRIERRESSAQQRREIQTFRIVVELAAINGEPRRTRERFRKALFEQVGHVVADASLDRRSDPW